MTRNLYDGHTHGGRQMHRPAVVTNKQRAVLQQRTSLPNRGAANGVDDSWTKLRLQTLSHRLLPTSTEQEHACLKVPD
jgi:hypothetical protein